MYCRTRNFKGHLNFTYFGDNNNISKWFVLQSTIASNEHLRPGHTDFLCKANSKWGRLPLPLEM